MYKRQFIDRLKVVVEQCQLRDVLGRKIANLSKGYRQRVGLAQALIHDPQILILDEPTVGLDPNQIREIRALIQEIGKTKTVLLSTHILQEVAATCQRVMIINKGQIAATGTPAELVQKGQGQTTYDVAVRGEVKAIEQELSALPHFVQLTYQTIQDDLHQFSVQCNDNQDQSETIFDTVVKNNWRLSRLVRQNQSLEDVFKDITK